MTISYSWLKDYLECDLTPEQVAAALTSIGLEVDSLSTVEAVPGGLKGVVVAYVADCVPHPDSDHLHVTRVDLGDCPEREACAQYLNSDGLLQVVCGAPNVAKGQKVLLATPGTILPGDFKIKKSKIRGVESFGMICAEDELSLGSSHEGIMVLDDSAVPGTAASSQLGLEGNAIIEIGLTANRVDAASHIGVARDLYAYLKFNGIPCKLNVPDVSACGRLLGVKGSARPVEVTVEAPEAAPRYSGVTLENVKVAPSPKWLADKLLSVGLRPINNVVDITNFVLMESGQPLHAFDASRIGEGRIVVRMAGEGERIVTLDGMERTLCDKDLVIADARKPMCIAGVFGGAESGTSEDTSTVFLESAWFNAVSIRKTSKRHTLKTDASFRYERGADPLANEWALERAVLLMNEICGATVSGDMVRVYSSPVSRKEVSLDYDRIRAFVGKALENSEIERILDALGYDFKEKSAGGALVLVPSYMTDVYRECDVVEEILRIYGYDNVEIPSGVHGSVGVSPRPDSEAVRTAISDFLASNGFNEMMNNSLTRGEYYDKLTTCPPDRCVRLLNPLSSDLNVMRQSLLPGGLEVIAYNINRQCTCMKLFEYGSVYSLKTGGEAPDTTGKIEEHTAFGLFLTGSPDKAWNATPSKGGFFALKGYLELLLRRVGTDPYRLETEAAPSDLYSEGLKYNLPGGGGTLAVIGTVSPSLAKRFGIRQPVFAAEISWPVLFRLIKRNKVQYSEMPKFPEVRRDLALLVDEPVSYADMRSTAIKAGHRMVRSISLFDVYRGDKIPAGKKQYALSFILQDKDKTLTDADTERIMNGILTQLQKSFGATIR